MLSACAEGPALGLLQEGGPRSRATLSPPLIKAQMVQGAVTLVPPSGYCIDPKSLTQRFALMARCDVLGGTNSGLDAPLGLLTVSIAKNAGTALNTTHLTGASSTNVIETHASKNIDVIRAQTMTPPKGLSNDHLRAAAQINGFDLSIALFSSVDSTAQGSRGPLMLQNLVRGSQNASVATSAATNITE